MASEPSETRRIKHLRERLKTHTDSDALAHLAHAVLGDADSHLSHARALAQLPSYIADEITGLPVSTLYPDIKRHLDLCPDCEAEYVDLLDLAQQEAAGELLKPAQVPHPDLSFLPQKVSLLSYVRALSKDLVAILQPGALPDFQVIADAFFKWIERQGGQLVLVRTDIGEALDLNEGVMSDAALILTATQLTTQSLVDVLTQESSQAQIVRERLYLLALEQAEKSAQKTGLDSDAVQEFARRYAEQITQESDSLQKLLMQYRPYE
ncbi:hypothetical protein TFLX_03982 [Thermoflexales bacterium]|nr:hypothetical protein TFLX_03982 [Thermoflexales bacterium]